MLQLSLLLIVSEMNRKVGTNSFLSDHDNHKLPGVSSSRRSTIFQVLSFDWNEREREVKLFSEYKYEATCCDSRR